MRAAITAAVAVGALAIYSWLCVVMQELEVRRDIGSFRDRLAALAAERGAISDRDIVATVQQIARASGAEVDAEDVEVIAASVPVRYGGNGPCRFGRLPSQYRHMNADDRRRFDSQPPRCDERRWIIGFRARIRASRWLAHSEITLERYTWTPRYDPEPGPLWAIR